MGPPSNSQTIAANMSGDLHVRLETDMVTATTYFKNLQNHHFQDTSMVQEDQSHDSSTMYEARVDIRKFSQFLQGQFNPTKVICSKWFYALTGKGWLFRAIILSDIIDGRGLQIFLLHEDVSLQYYIPAVAR